MSHIIFKTIRRRIKYTFLYGFVMMMIGIANLLPRKAWLWICGLLGKILFVVAPKLKNQITKHLLIAFGNEMTSGEIKDLARQVFIMLGKNAGTVLRGFISSPKNNVDKRSIIHGLKYAEEAYQRGHGVIFLTAHIGPFECIADELSLRGFHPYIIGTPLKDEMLNKLVVQNRTKFGGVAIERGKETYRVMKNIKTGGTMAILIDQDTSVKSVFVDFFGKSCSTPVGAAMIALKTGAAVIPVFTHLNKNGIQEIDYYPAVEIQKTNNEENDLRTNTQTLTSIIENEIRKFPEQWIWMHRRWKTVSE